MNSFLTPQFLTLYRVLPEHVRQQARQAYALFQQDPHHPSLRFRQVHPVRPIYSARVVQTTERLASARATSSSGFGLVHIATTIIC